jgi:hypothetical protein
VGHHRFELFCVDHAEWLAANYTEHYTYHDLRRLAGSCVYECEFTARIVPPAGIERGDLNAGTEVATAVEAAHAHPPLPNPFAAAPGSTANLAAALAFVSGTSENIAARASQAMGVAKVRFLAAQGLQKQHRFLEFGCGTLDLARELLPRLSRRGAYACVEPNQWLPLAVLQYHGNNMDGDSLAAAQVGPRSQI